MMDRLAVVFLGTVLAAVVLTVVVMLGWAIVLALANLAGMMDCAQYTAWWRCVKGA